MRKTWVLIIALSIILVGCSLPMGKNSLIKDQDIEDVDIHEEVSDEFADESIELMKHIVELKAENPDSNQSFGLLIDNVFLDFFNKYTEKDLNDELTEHETNLLMNMVEVSLIMEGYIQDDSLIEEEDVDTLLDVIKYDLAGVYVDFLEAQKDLVDEGDLYSDGVFQVGEIPEGDYVYWSLDEEEALKLNGEEIPIDGFNNVKIEKDDLKGEISIDGFLLTQDFYEEILGELGISEKDAEHLFSSGYQKNVIGGDHWSELLDSVNE